MSLSSYQEATRFSEREEGDSDTFSDMEDSDEDEDVDMYAEEKAGVILKEFALAHRRSEGDEGKDEDDNYNENDVQTVKDIARQAPVVSIQFAPNLAEFFSHPSQTFPTLVDGRAALREKAHSEGFTIKTLRENNADKQEGECSQRTGKEYHKKLYILCICAGKKPRDAAVKLKRGARSRRTGCQWTAEIKKVDGSYRVNTSGEHNHVATSDVRIFPAARRATPEQEIFVLNLIKARAYTHTILDNLRDTFGDSCLLIAKDIQNRKHKYREQQKA
uniref:FAR1 domain-containing protein n=1 Tax=Hyaloperonospora arabidopsidis (strain Emoy2) TaxID=559515 RepID=M4B7D0_HYAAE